MSSASAALLMNGGTYAPYGTITADNHGSYIIIVTWTFACISVLFVAVRVILRTWMSKHVGWDDGLIVAALLFAIGQSTAASKSVQYGLGRHVDSLDNEQIRSYYRSTLASEIMSTFVFVFTKLALTVLIAHITPSNIMRYALVGFSVIIMLWGISDVFSVSFQCGIRVPMRYLDHQCVNEAGLVFAHGGINIVSDLVLVAFPVFLVWQVHIPFQQKLIVSGLFWSRITVCVVSGIMLGTVDAYLLEKDPTWDALQPSFWNQIAVHLSVITACVPSIKPFFDSLQSSLIDSGIPRNYPRGHPIELHSWRTSNKRSAHHLSWRISSSLRAVGLTSTVHNEIEGGRAISTTGLTEGVIHQQRDVKVAVT